MLVGTATLYMHAQYVIEIACSPEVYAFVKHQHISHAGYYRRVVKMVQKRYPHSELLAAGWSLGGNILVRYIGEEGDSCPISAAASLCNPLDLVQPAVHALLELVSMTAIFSMTALGI